jgi:hypothetical protein
MADDGLRIAFKELGVRDGSRQTFSGDQET